jgi:hypothetical protein
MTRANGNRKAFIPYLTRFLSSGMGQRLQAAQSLIQGSFRIGILTQKVL